MKYFFSACVMCVLSVCCSGPQTITTSPNNHTNTSGTLGSGNMTNTMPATAPDTSGIKRDSLPGQQR